MAVLLAIEYRTAGGFVVEAFLGATQVAVFFLDQLVDETHVLVDRLPQRLVFEPWLLVLRIRISAGRGVSAAGARVVLITKFKIYCYRSSGITVLRQRV